MPRQPRRIEGLTFAEIAVRTGLTDSAIRHRYHAGETTLAALLAPARKRGPKPRIIDGASVAEHAARGGPSRDALYARLRAGIPIAEAIDPAPRVRQPHAPDALDEAIWCERLGADGPTTTQAELGRRFGLTRAAVSLREIALRGGG